MVAEKIKALRESNNMTQNDVAKRLGITRSSVNAWEMGISVPTAAKLVELALFFHVSMDYMLGLEQAEVVSLAGFTEEQKRILYSLMLYFEKEDC